MDTYTTDLYKIKNACSSAPVSIGKTLIKKNQCSNPHFTSTKSTISSVPLNFYKQTYMTYLFKKNISISIYFYKQLLKYLHLAMQSGMYYYQQGQMYHILSKPINCCAIPIACLSAVYVCICLTVQSQPCSHSDIQIQQVHTIKFKDVLIHNPRRLQHPIHFVIG